MTERSNLPGRDALDYRIGTQSSFARSMQLALGDHPALSSLSTRETDDPLVALVDAWACALDVLTFYQERIANEGFLGTAIERRSVLELARSIGYELSPGVGRHHLAQRRGGAGARWHRRVHDQGRHQRPEHPRARRAAAGVRDGRGDRRPPGLELDPRRVRAADGPGTRRHRCCASPAPTSCCNRATRSSCSSAARRRGSTCAASPRRTWCRPCSPRRPTSCRSCRHTPRWCSTPPSLHNTGTPNPASGVSGAAVHVLRQRTALFGFNAPPWDALPVSLRVGDLNPAYGIENIAFDTLQVREAWRPRRSSSSPTRWRSTSRRRTPATRSSPRPAARTRSPSCSRARTASGRPRGPTPPSRPAPRRSTSTRCTHASSRARSSRSNGPARSSSGGWRP